MIESIVATSLVVIGILGIMSLLARSAHISHFTTHSLQATYLAAEGIEVVKNILDTDVAKGLAWGTHVTTGSYCVSYDTSALVSCSGQGDLAYDPATGFYSATSSSSYFRRIVAITGSGNSFDVSSTVRWYEGGIEKSVTLEDTFENWRSP